MNPQSSNLDCYACISLASDSSNVLVESGWVGSIPRHPGCPGLTARLLPKEGLKAQIQQPTLPCTTQGGPEPPIQQPDLPGTYLPSEPTCMGQLQCQPRTHQSDHSQRKATDGQDRFRTGRKAPLDTFQTLQKFRGSGDVSRAVVQ